MASDAIAGSAAWLFGVEIVNDSRTNAYLRNGIKPPTLTVNGDCGCDNILALAGCDDEYTNPAQDNAPWYDPAIPESAEFAGFLRTEFEGLASTYTRSVTESIGDGATLGRSRLGSRTMTWKGYLFGSSCCGVAYGLRWLGKTLQGVNSCGNNCFGEDLELLVCCPTIEAAQGLGPNLLCNPDFDVSTVFWAPSGTTAITWVNDPYHIGPGAMKVVNPLIGAITFNTGGADCLMPVTQSKNYKLSLQTRAEVGAGAAALGVTFNWFNSLGVALAPTVFANLGSDSETAWTLREATATAPLTAASVRLSFTIGTGATLPNTAHFIDSVSLNQVAFANKVDPFRTIKGVSLLEGPLVLSERKMGTTCGGRCGGSTAVEIEFSLVGSQPWLYSAPIPIVNCVSIEENSVTIIGKVLSGVLNTTAAGATTITSSGFANLPVVLVAGNLFLVLDPAGAGGPPEVVLVTAHAAASTSITVLRGQQGTIDRSHSSTTYWVVQTSCAPDNCGDGLLAAIFPACAPVQLPPTATYVGCIVPNPNDYKAVYITAPRASWNSISEVVPVITIQVGGFPLLDARIGFYTSADANPCGDLINNPPNCDAICDTLNITALPANSKLYIDGRTNKISLVCGTNAVFPGEPFTLGPFSWPSFSCYGFCMEFAYNPVNSAEGNCISLSLVPRTTL